MSVGIYKFENKINGHKYIGQSKDLSQRYFNHICDANNEGRKGYNYPLYRAIRKYGITNFDYEIIENCLVDELNEKEIYWIKYYDSFFNGYNQTLGGEQNGYNKIDSDLLLSITEYLKTSNETDEEIGNKFGLHRNTIWSISNGKTWYRDEISYPIKKVQEKEHKYCIDCGKEINFHSERCEECDHVKQRVVERPEALVLAKEVIDNGFESVGRKYGVSGNSIKKWCKAYGMGKLKHEVAVWYEKNK